MLLPYVAPVVAVAFVWEVALSPQYGVVNDWGHRLFGWDNPIAFLSTASTRSTCSARTSTYRWPC